MYSKYYIYSKYDHNLLHFMIDIGKLARVQKQIIVMVADMFCVLFSIWLGFSLRLGELYVFNAKQLVLLLSIALLVTIPVFISFGLYRAVIRYVGVKALWAVLQAVTISVLIWGVLAVSFDFQMPRSVPLIVWLVLIMLIGGSRILARSLFATLENRVAKKTGQKNIYIYGAGKAGIQLAKAFERDANMHVVGFIDDDEILQNKYILGLKVSSFQSVEKLFAREEGEYIDEVLLALPSASHSRRAKIIRQLEAFSIQVRTLPGLSELAQGKINIDAVKEVDIADLLGRESVQPNKVLLYANIKNKAILVTGAGGSIGSELCRQIISLQPKRLVLFELSELALYQIEKELLGLLLEKQIEIIPVLGSVVNQQRVERVCNVFGIQTIYHAAAYKHVPMVEKNISEGIQNNILGTFHCAKAAIATKVETFVLISTDKAVRPTNTMGATKRFAELILQGLSQKDKQHNTRFIMVRFGNVLGSSGSVIPLFKEQIRNGKVVTVTDPKIVRYFMTIPEASQLVIQAGAMGKGGDVFVLDMGKPIKIIDLAKRMIRLSGYEIKSKDNPDGDIEIAITGLRPGEKLYEELLIGDNVSKTDHQRIMRAQEEILPWDTIDEFMQKIKIALTLENEADLRIILQKAVNGFKPQCRVVDVLYNKVEPFSEK
jgi:FlaA1/EpsC-like NDP-sugar epimerase